MHIIFFIYEEFKLHVWKKERRNHYHAQPGTLQTIILSGTEYNPVAH